MAISKALSKLEDGSYFDRIKRHIRYGDEFPLSADDKLVLDRIERVKELLVHHKDQPLVLKMLRDEELFEGLKPAQLYNYVNDAKALYALSQSFNVAYELVLQKQYIDKLFKLAEEEKDSKMFATALEENRKLIAIMEERERRSIVKEEKSYDIFFHMDFTKIGVSEQTMAEWQPELDEIIRKSHIKYKDVIELTEKENGTFS